MLRLGRVSVLKRGRQMFQPRSRSIDVHLPFARRRLWGDDVAGSIQVRSFASGSSDDKEKNLKKDDGSGGGGGGVTGAVKVAMEHTWEMIRHPDKTWILIKETANHYWLGSKLLWTEMKMAQQILSRLVRGHGMTRRERMQLIRTTMDLFRLVPFSIFVIVPFMEFLLPVALKLFPNMLPSTFQDSLKKEEAMKMELQMRLAVAGFFQETLQEMAKKKKASNTEATAGKDVIEFIEKARLGEPLNNDTVIRIAGHFKDELTLANIARPQLVSMCQYMGVKPFGADAFLRFQLRTKLRAIKEDDRRILWEGIDSLTFLELREACQERGMRTFGLTEFGYKKQLQEWLDLSIQKNIPISLLIMSRAFMLTSTSSHTEDVLKSSMSSLDSDTINEVVLAVAMPAEESSIDMRMRKLESVQFQNEMINEEREETQEAKAAATAKDKGKEKLAKDAASEKLSAAAAAASASSSSASKKLDTSASSSSPAYSTTPFPDASLLNDEDEIESSPASKSSLKQENELFAKDKEVVVEEAKELTMYEVQTLGDLARGSSVEREKAELAALEASVDAVEIEDAVPAAQQQQQQQLQQQQQGEGFGAGPIHQHVEAGASFKKDEGLAAKGKEAIMALVSSSKVKSSSAADTQAETLAAAEKEKPDKSIMRMRSALNLMVGKLKDKIESTEKALEDKLPQLDMDGDGELTNEELKSAILRILKTKSPKEAEEIIAMLDSDNDGRISISELLQFVEEKKKKVEIEILEKQVDVTQGGGANKT